jgi:hypothetical protein
MDCSLIGLMHVLGQVLLYSMIRCCASEKAVYPHPFRLIRVSELELLSQMKTPSLITCSLTWPHASQFNILINLH